MPVPSANWPPLNVEKRCGRPGEAGAKPLPNFCRPESKPVRSTTAPNAGEAEAPLTPSLPVAPVELAPAAAAAPADAPALLLLLTKLAGADDPMLATWRAAPGVCAQT